MYNAHIKRLLNKGVSLTILVISILLIVVSTEPHEAFAKKYDDKEKHDKKDKEKHDKKDKEKPDNDDEVTPDNDDEVTPDNDDEVTPDNDDEVTPDNDDEVTPDNDDEVTPDNDDEVNTNEYEEEPKFEPSQFKGSGNDYAPTLGSDRYGNNYVDNGFTFNDFTTDVEELKTHMPLQTLNVGELNTAVLKIYDNRGG